MVCICELTMRRKPLQLMFQIVSGVLFFIEFGFLCGNCHCKDLDLQRPTGSPLKRGKEWNRPIRCWHKGLHQTHKAILQVRVTSIFTYVIDIQVMWMVRARSSFASKSAVFFKPSEWDSCMPHSLRDLHRRLRRNATGSIPSSLSNYILLFFLF